MVGSFRRFSPATTTSTARHCGSRRILPCAHLCTVAMTRCLASCPVSLWVVHLASREPARHCRPSDVKTSRRDQSGRSVEKFLPTSGLLSPQTPTLPPSRQLGFQGMHLISVHACLVWTRLHVAHHLLPPCYRFSMCLPAAVILTALTALDLEQNLEHHLAASDR